ncbi:adenosylcobinamide-phosphate synthase CbiB [Paenibacillus koleovorans]|uniref:adenosylcobinamide-phosphate synthase CbiB n=1 Tax=Paenibacillus koleovorans TaxID=121608 RepID=UPI000FD841DC|nr:adenosylcobinamide-phosphate synthase CbiB [Paenibacillus koleovorans]
MLIYSLPETALMIAAAIALDWLIGDPRWLTHPVVWIGRFITWLSGLLRRREQASERGSGASVGSSGASVGLSPLQLRLRGVLLTAATVLLAFAAVWLLWCVADRIHPWLGYAVNVWFISTTIAVRGLRDAAVQVLEPLSRGDLTNARKYVGYIVGRDTDKLEEREIVRATVETVSENTVDAVVSPLVFALLGGAPLAMLYRAANTLDSMVGYKNEKYRYFGWASARFDDVLNYIPARMTGLLIVLYSLLEPGLSARRSFQAIRRFAHLHPSPNSGIPESAVAGAMGVELGGLNRYGEVVSDRARMGWPEQELRQHHIGRTNRICYGISWLWMGAMGCIWAISNL